MVSLVPSLTELVAVTRPSALVGATTWCTHPAGLDVARVRGTKNPDLAAIRALEPDLVLANQEENRRVDVERLRAAGIPVWVTVIRDLDEAVASLRRMFSQRPGLARTPVAHPGRAGLGAARPRPPGSAPPSRSGATPGWWSARARSPATWPPASAWTTSTPTTPAATRTSSCPISKRAALHLIVLPDEPYAFSATDGPEMFPAHRVALVEGRDLTWYGPSLITARPALLAAISPKPPAALAAYARQVTAARRRAAELTWTTTEAAALLWELTSFHVWDDLVNDAQIAPDRYVEIITTAALGTLGTPMEVVSSPRVRQR